MLTQNWEAERQKLGSAQKLKEELDQARTVAWPSERAGELAYEKSELEKKLLALAFEHAIDRDAGPARNDARDLVGRDRLFHHRALLLLRLD